MGVGMTNLLIQASVEKRPGFEAGMSNLEMIVVRPAWISRRGRGGLAPTHVALSVYKWQR